MVPKMIEVGGIVDAVSIGTIRIRSRHCSAHRIIDGQFCEVNPGLAKQALDHCRAWIDFHQLELAVSRITLEFSRRKAAEVERLEKGPTLLAQRLLQWHGSLNDAYAILGRMAANLLTAHFCNNLTMTVYIASVGS